MNTIIVMWRSLNIGGIENFSYKLMKKHLMAGDCVYWFTTDNGEINLVYSDLFSFDNFHKVCVKTRGFRWTNFPNINLSIGDKVIYFSFSIFDYFRGLSYKKKYEKKGCVFNPILAVPHFKGGSIYFENTIRKNDNYLTHRASNIYYKIYNSNSLFCFSKRHFEELEKRYGLILENRFYVPDVDSNYSFNINDIIKRYNSAIFKVVSVGRFDFPHKGYVLGLIDDICRLIDYGNNITLEIYGTGIDENVIQKKYNMLKENYKNYIKIGGGISEDEFASILKEANVFVGLAGCAVFAAKCGVPVLAARHYSNECEVYGFYFNGSNIILSNAPGEKVDCYINRLQNMTYSEYELLCSKTYDSFPRTIYNTNDLFEHNFLPINFTFKDFLLMKFLCIVGKIKFKLGFGDNHS